MKNYDVELTIRDLPEDEYDDAIDQIQEYVSSVMGFHLDVGIGAEVEPVCTTPSSFDKQTDGEILFDAKHGTSCGMK